MKIIKTAVKDNKAVIKTGAVDKYFKKSFINKIKIILEIIN